MLCVTNGVVVVPLLLHVERFSRHTAPVWGHSTSGVVCGVFGMTPWCDDLAFRRGCAVVFGACALLGLGFDVEREGDLHVSMNVPTPMLTANMLCPACFSVPAR